MFLQTAMENLEDFEFDQLLNVIFIGEDGVDAGGLTREFFSLIFKHTPIFENSGFAINSTLLQNKTYKTIGKVVAFSILMGNQGPRCLLPQFTKFILQNAQPAVGEISDEMLTGDVLQALKEIDSLEALNVSEVFEKNADILESAGYKKMLTLENKKEAMLAIRCHYGFYRFLPPLLQFIEGLKLHGVYKLLMQYSAEATEYFSRTDVKALDVINLFHPSFSIKPEDKELEEIIVYNFHQFLKKLERGKISTQWLDMETDLEDDVQLNTGHFLLATTGSPAISPNIGDGLLLFDHANLNCTTVNTCAPSITINQTKYMKEYDFLENAFINIIVCGFGLN
ncbi:uncharacterized protein LOC126831591 [Patella vulgata]|uniref:uncharacterized protein LOC126831591 n=1 Tax=Patella vulgata TaxID=6465 RepID=UPI00218004C7|nr:uncharacterized protein LOC126831591 [Patella vulgata]XP_055958776.1 uncharacterized protein LOC126831591 [Patella vulgata]